MDDSGSRIRDWVRPQEAQGSTGWSNDGSGSEQKIRNSEFGIGNAEWHSRWRGAGRLGWEKDFWCGAVKTSCRLWSRMAFPTNFPAFLRHFFQKNRQIANGNEA